MSVTGANLLLMVEHLVSMARLHSHVCSTLCHVHVHTCMHVRSSLGRQYLHYRACQILLGCPREASCPRTPGTPGWCPCQEHSTDLHADRVRCVVGVRGECECVQHGCCAHVVYQKVAQHGFFAECDQSVLGSQWPQLA